jgi:tetratricopeptide (TPR) repeat protein
LVGGIFLAFAQLATSGAVRAQTEADPAELNRAFRQFYEAGDLSATTEFAEYALAVAERVHGGDHADIATALSNLGLAYKAQGRFAEAEQGYRRSLAMREKVSGPDHESIAIVTNNLAELYRDLGRYAEAEPLYKRSLVVREKTKGADDLFVTTALNNLALLYDLQGRDAEAEASFKRVIQIRERALSADSPNLGGSLHGLAHHYVKLRRYAEAEPLYLRARAIAEKAYGPDHREVGLVLGNLAELYRAQRRYTDAEPLFLRAMTIAETTLGPSHSDVGILANNIGVFYASQRRFADAEPFYKRSLAITQASLGPDHPDVAAALANLAALNFLQSNWAAATVYGRQATDIRVRRTRRQVGTFGSTGKSEFELWRNDFQGLLKAAGRLAETDKARPVPLIVEMFPTAQWIQTTEAASSLAQMAASYGAGGALSGHVRERQDLVNEWKGRDKALTLVRLTAADKRDANAEVAAAVRLTAIDTRIAEIDRTLAKDFPEYSSLVGAEPLSVYDVQAMLGPDEALLLFVTTTRWPPSPT